MTGRASLAEELRCIILGLTVALIPKPENQRLARSWGVDAEPYSFAIGIAEAIGGGLGFFFGAIASMSGSVPTFNMLLLENWFPKLTTTHFGGGGLISLLIWCCHPVAWILVTMSLTGTLRVVAFATSREAVGEPLVWLILRSYQALDRLWRRRSSLQRLGPMRPDRLLWGKGSDLSILCCRTREEWTETPALVVDERFFALAEVEERVEGAYSVIAYHFRELEPNEVIRRAIPYVDTAVRDEELRVRDDRSRV